MAHDTSGHESLSSDMYFGGRRPQPTPIPSGLLQSCVELSKGKPDCFPPVTTHQEATHSTNETQAQQALQHNSVQESTLLPLVREGGRRILGTPHN